MLVEYYCQSKCGHRWTQRIPGPTAPPKLNCPQCGDHRADMQKQVRIEPDMEAAQAALIAWEADRKNPELFMDVIRRFQAVM